MSLLRQIQDAAIDSSVSLPTLLRKCKVLAARLGSDEFKRWIDFELSGYPSKDELPGYRVLHVNSKGHFSGGFGSGLRNADIPLFCIPEQLRENLSHCYLLQPISAMESLVAGGGNDNMQEPWNPDIVAHVGQQIYEHMNCMQAWKVVPRPAIVAALDAVRTRVLNFAIEIEAQNPSAGEAAPNSHPLPMDKVNQIFNTYISGGVQNLATGSSDVAQTATLVERTDAELFAKLLEVVKAVALHPDAKEAITASIDNMGSTQGTGSFKGHYLAFMSMLSDHMQVLGPVVAPFLPALSAMVP